MRVCCHSNETRASIANPPNSAQLEGTPTIPAGYIRVRAEYCGEWQTDRHTDGRGHYTFRLGYGSREIVCVLERTEMAVCYSWLISVYEASAPRGWMSSLGLRDELSSELKTEFQSPNSNVFLRSVRIKTGLHEIHEIQQIEGSVHKGSISRNPNFSGNEFLCFASFTS